MERRSKTPYIVHPEHISDPITRQRAQAIYLASRTTLSLALTHLDRAHGRLASLNINSGTRPSTHAGQVAYDYRSGMMYALHEGRKALEAWLPGREWRKDDVAVLPAEYEEHLEEAVREAELGLQMLVDSRVAWGWSEEKGWRVEGVYPWWEDVEDLRREWREEHTMVVETMGRDQAVGDEESSNSEENEEELWYDVSEDSIVEVGLSEASAGETETEEETGMTNSGGDEEGSMAAEERFCVSVNVQKCGGSGTTAAER